MRRWYTKHDRPPVPARQTLLDQIRQWFRDRVITVPLSDEDREVLADWDRFMEDIREELPWKRNPDEQDPS